MNKRKNEVIEIPAKPVETDQPVKRQLRVAAYCRVSTSQESQQNSYQAQKAYYTDKIASNPDWCLAGIFADEGISGTSAEKRPAFQRMIRCCKKGKIDLILTKSISRLSRNTVDCLQYVRLLQELRIPVIFEAEGINTLNMQNEFLLAVMGANSQAESEATSSRVKWGVRNAFREGKVRYYYQYWLGYRKGKDGTPEIIPEEAETVKQIYADYLSGKSLRSIADSLESRGILPRAGQAKWTTTYIRGILQNERYTGDALLQKTYTTDPITKKQKKNRGELPQYLVKNCHPAIISHELFDLVQKEISRRSVATGNSDADSARPKPAYSGKYTLSELLVCGECNTLYSGANTPPEQSEADGGGNGTPDHRADPPLTEEQPHTEAPQGAEHEGEPPAQDGSLSASPKVEHHFSDEEVRRHYEHTGVCNLAGGGPSGAGAVLPPSEYVSRDHLLFPGNSGRAGADRSQSLGGLYGASYFNAGKV